MDKAVKDADGDLEFAKKLLKDLQEREAEKKKREEAELTHPRPWVEP